MREALGSGDRKSQSARVLHLGQGLVTVMGLLLLAGCPPPPTSPTPSTSNQAPSATISSPADGSSFTSGDTITFQGSASDPEDGDLSGSSLVWTSSRDGQIGTGQSFKWSKLSVGTHTVTLEATDSQGATGSTSVSVTVTAAPAGTEQRLAFTSDRIGYDVVFTIAVDGTGLQQVTSDLSEASDGQPAWSPDGQRIAYLNDYVGATTLRWVTPDGSQDQELAANGSSAAWSPSGDSLVTTIGFSEIAIVSRHGSTPRPVLDVELIPNNGGASPHFANQGWAPDTTGVLLLGRREQILLFDMYEYVDCRRESHSGIWITSPASDTARYFPAICQLGGNASEPVISPDGTKLAFAADPAGNLDIYVYDFQTGTIKPITQDPANDTDPSWSPDGSQIAFASERDGQFEIYVMNADGSGITRVTHDPDNLDRWPAWSPGP